MSSKSGKSKSRTDLDSRGSIERAVKHLGNSIDAESARQTEYFKRFLRGISNEDLTGVLVRGHLFAENEMATILSNAVPQYSKIPSRQLMFEAKVAWLRGLALISCPERTTLEQLNNMRNSIAHITVPGTVPEVDAKEIEKLRDTLAPTMRELLDEAEFKATDPASILRAAIVAIVIGLYIRADVTNDEFSIADLVRYHLTGETVQQRTEKAKKLSESDSSEVKDVKRLVGALNLEDRDNLRTWMREVYHY